jgi:hypothetical protein
MGHVTLSSIFADDSGINSVYGVYISYYLQHGHFEGGTPFKYAWIGGASVSTGLACAPLLGYLNGQISLRIQYSIGSASPWSSELTSSDDMRAARSSHGWVVYIICGFCDLSRGCVWCRSVE